MPYLKKNFIIGYILLIDTHFTLTDTKYKLHGHCVERKGEREEMQDAHTLLNRFYTNNPSGWVWSKLINYANISLCDISCNSLVDLCWLDS